MHRPTTERFRAAPAPVLTAPHKRPAELLPNSALLLFIAAMNTAQTRL